MLASKPGEHRRSAAVFTRSRALRFSTYNDGLKLNFAEHRLHSDYGKRSRHKVAPVHRVQNKHLRMILASLREHCLGRRPANFESSIASRILMVENACRISHRC